MSEMPASIQASTFCHTSEKPSRTSRGCAAALAAACAAAGAMPDAPAEAGPPLALAGQPLVRKDGSRTLNPPPLAAHKPAGTIAIFGWVEAHAARRPVCGCLAFGAAVRCR